MDIVDKVFEGLSLKDEADKTRKITAHQRKKEMRKRLHLRVGILMASAVAIIGLTVTGIVLNMPKSSVADSDVEVEFSAPIVEEEAIVDTVEISEETEEAPATTETTTTGVSRVSTKKQSTPTASTTPKTTATKILSVLDSNGEKLDQGQSDCKTINGNLLMCDNSTATPTTPANESDAADDGNGDVTEENSDVSGT